MSKVSMAGVGESQFTGMTINSNGKIDAQVGTFRLGWHRASLVALWQFSSAIIDIDCQYGKAYNCAVVNFQENP